MHVSLPAAYLWRTACSVSISSNCGKRMMKKKTKMLPKDPNLSLAAHWCFPPCRASKAFLLFAVFFLKFCLSTSMLKALLGATFACHYLKSLWGNIPHICNENANFPWGVAASLGAAHAGQCTECKAHLLLEWSSACKCPCDSVVVSSCSHSLHCRNGWSDWLEERVPLDLYQNQSHTRCHSSPRCLETTSCQKRENPPGSTLSFSNHQKTPRTFVRPFEGLNLSCQMCKAVFLTGRALQEESLCKPLHPGRSLQLPQSQRLSEEVHSLHFVISKACGAPHFADLSTCWKKKWRPQTTKTCNKQGIYTLPIGSEKGNTKQSITAWHFMKTSNIKTGFSLGYTMTYLVLGPATRSRLCTVASEQCCLLLLRLQGQWLLQCRCSTGALCSRRGRGQSKKCAEFSAWRNMRAKPQLKFCKLFGILMMCY